MPHKHRIPDFSAQPLYTVLEVSRFARVPSSTVQTWIGKQGLIVPAKRSPATLSFLNLVEVFVLAAIRRRHRISMQKVRSAIKYVSRHSHLPRPLVQEAFWTDNVDLFVNHLGIIVNTSCGGQLEIKETIQQGLTRIEWHGGVAARIFPFTRDEITNAPRVIVIAPEYSFGQPVIAGTGARVSVIRERFRAGERAQDLAEDYGVSCEQIEEALRMDAA